jgi:hypothetical protein
MGTVSDYSQRVARTPRELDEQQRNLLDELEAAAKEATAADKRYKDLLTRCDQADIPITQIAARLRVTRKTVYRHLGRSMT